MSTDDDEATTCDGCGRSIPWGALAYMIPTGERRDALPVVRVECESCYR